MKRRFFEACSLLIMSLFFYVAGNSQTNVPSELKSVTIYRSGAEMIHNASVTLKEGNNEVVIENISNQLDINSIQIKAPTFATIMGVEFSNNFLKKNENTPRIKSLEDSLERARKEWDKIALATTNTKDLLDVLKANKDIKGTQTGLSVAELMKLMDYYKTKSTELQTELAQLKEKATKTNEQIERIDQQIEEEKSKNVSYTGRLTLQLSAATPGKADLVISYIAQNAYWTPYYDIKVESTQKPLTIVYKAKITQTTGIDWKKVKLSLSTSVPSQWGNAPVLQQWFLSYINPVNVMNRSLSSNSIQAYKSYERSAAKSEDLMEVDAKSVTIRGTGSISANNKPLYVVNGNVMSAEDVAKINQSSIKSMNVLKDASATALYGARGNNGVVVVTLKSEFEDYVSVADNTLNVTFDIDIPYDVPTNGKEQTATLKTLQLPAFYKHYAVPKLDMDAFLLAEVPEWQKLNLLPGNANVIFEGTYVGKTFIDPNSTQDTLNLTLGKDKRVAVKREKLTDYSSTKFMGSSKQQKITYEITVKNNKNEPISLMLKDQFPMTTQKEIEVELTDAGGAVVNNDIGVLTWRLSLAAGESKKVRFSYSVKYPKDKSINLN